MANTSLGKSRPSGKTTRSQPGKPKIPKRLQNSFPLRPHVSGKFRKTIDGRDYYFGRVTDGKPADAAEALRQFNAIKSDLMAGHDPPATSKPGESLEWLCNHFMDDRSGRVTKRSLDEYHAAAKRMLACLGKTRNINKLGPLDFESLLASYPATWGQTRRDNEIGRVRTILNHAWNIRAIDAPLFLGERFKQSSKRDRRKQRAVRRRKGLNKQFSAAEVAAMVDAAGVQLRAMILLGINAGFNCADCGQLETSYIDLESGWLDYERDKTFIRRTAKLWPETIEAIQLASEIRRAPNLDRYAGRVFITKYGHPWYRESERVSPISQATTKLIKELGFYRPGVSFTALREMCKTIGRNVDEAACKVVLGHDSDVEIGDIYSQYFDRSRIEAVCDGIRSWYMEGRDNA